MKRLLVALLLFCVPAPAHADTTVAGSVTGPMTAADNSAPCFSGGKGNKLKVCTGGGIYVAPNPSVRKPMSVTKGACRTSNGCTAATQRETTTNKINYFAADFANAATTCWQVDYWLPKNYADGSTFTVGLEWIPDADVSSGDVLWAVKLGAYRDGSTADTALGSAVNITDTFIAAGKFHMTPDSAAITAAGSPVGGDDIVIEVCRVGGDAADTLTGGSANQADLMNVFLTFPIDKVTSED